MNPIYSTLNHPLRVPLAAEIHSRPFLHLEAPALVSHLAIYRSTNEARTSANQGQQLALLAALCRHFGVAAPAGDAKYFYHDFGRFRLKWECHTEFATFTFAQRMLDGLTPEQAFGQMPVTQLPQQWLLSLQGQVLVAANVLLAHADDGTQADLASLQRLFEGNMLVGSRVMQGGELWTDFAIQSDGFSRFVIRDIGMRAQQGGRLVQRVFEIETYRMMALLGLPYAQHAITALNPIESELAALATAMVDADNGSAASAAPQGKTEQSLLDDIIRLAARLEKLSLENSYRFSASKAYFGLVNARIDELRESRIEGIPTVGEFMDRRLAPAMNTCGATALRQEALARRIAHTNDLLRTRVNLVQEQQNRKILQSMNLRSAQQLRLQQAVEGLSVVAISYYLIGLTLYAAKAVKAAGMPVNPDLVAGLMVPVIAFGVWAGLRKLRKHLHVREKEERDAKNEVSRVGS